MLELTDATLVSSSHVAGRAPHCIPQCVYGSGFQLLTKAGSTITRLEGAVRVLMFHHVAPCYFQRTRDDSSKYGFAGYIHTMYLSW
jgi:hypothetical protein